MAQLMLVNPKKRRRKTTTKRRKPSPRRSLSTVKTTSVRKYRRNPIRKNELMDTVKEGAVGAAGALAVDVAMQKIPFIPENLKTGTFAPVTRGLVGIGIGMVVAKFGKNRRLGKQLADGAVTVALYSSGKNLIGPSLGLSDGELLGPDSLLYYGNEDDTMGYYDDEGDAMGYTNAASVFDSDEEF